MQAKKSVNTTATRAKSTDKAKKEEKEENVSKKGRTEEKVSRRSKSKKKDKNAPKKALSSYMLWSLNERKKLAEEGIAGKDIMAELGRRWPLISEKEKKKWEDLNLKDKERYEREMN